MDEECDEEVTVDSLTERAQLMEVQRKDETLKDIREWAKKRYALEDGLLVHNLVSPAEQIHKQIVVPTGRRSSLLKLPIVAFLEDTFP